MLGMKPTFFLLWVIAAAIPAPVLAAVYYCDPVNGDTQNGNGNPDNPWGTLESVVGAGHFAGTIVDGDVLKLRTGFHGEFDSAKFHGDYRIKSSFVTIEADDGAVADLSRVILKGCSRWCFRGLRVSPELATPSMVTNHGVATPGIFYGYGNDHITIEGCTIYTVNDASAWDVNDWTNLTWYGTDLSATHVTLRNNIFRNLRTAIKGIGPNSLVEGNLIDGFSNDGINFGGPNTTIQDNIVVNVYNNAGDPHWHSDGIQAWGDAGDAGWHLTVRGNYINARTDPSRDPDTIQGLQGLFLRGFKDINDVVVENNVVLALHSSHGLVLGYGEGYTVRNSRIVGNTVINPYGLSDGGHPNIHLSNATPENVLIRNNIADSWPSPNASRGLVVDHNFDISNYNPDVEFRNYVIGDVYPAPGSHFIDTGTDEGAPIEDIEGRTRPLGQSADVGAYEYDPGGSGNRPPVLGPIGDRSVVADEQLSFSVSASDPDVDTLTHSATGLPNGATFSHRTFTWTPTSSQLGNCLVTFIVSDGQAQDSETITISVQALGAANAPPVLNPIGDRSVKENEPLSFSVSASDADGDPVTYSASNLPSGASFTGQSFSWTPSNNQAGDYHVTFVARDGRGQDSETVTISVTNINRPPVLSSIGDRAVDENASLAFSIAANDPDGDNLTYSASGVPSGADFAGPSFSWTPTSSQVGSHEITFITSDGQLQDSETITILVVSAAPDSTPPVVARCSPAVDAIQVPLNNLLTLHVTDAGRGVDAGSVTIAVDDDIIYQGDTAVYAAAHGRCSRSGTRTDYRFVYQPDELFDFDKTVTVKVNAADLEGNLMSEHSYSFVTEMRAFGSNQMVDGNTDGPSKGRAATASDAGGKGGAATAGDAGGNIWTAWHAGQEGSRDIYVARLPAGADAFGSPTQLTNNDRDQCNPDMAVGSDGSVYVVWQDDRRGNWDIYLAVSSDGTAWSRPIQVTDSDSTEINPAIIVDHQSPNRAYIAWQDYRNRHYDIYLASSASAFADQTVWRVTLSGAHQTDADVAVDAQNTVYVVWTDMRNGQPDVYGSASNINAWANTPLVTTPSSQTSPAVATDPDGSTLHILWVDDAPGHNDIYYAASAGWPSSPLVGSSIIDDTSGAEQIAPAIACAGNLKVFACWQDFRHTDPTSGDSDLFLTELRSAGVRTNILVGDDGTNANQSEPALGIDGHAYPYVVWTDDRDGTTGIYYAASTFIDPNPLDSKDIVAAIGATIGPAPETIDAPDDVSIIVPGGACRSDIRITISKILNPQALAVECLGSYDFGPSGIDFDEPVTVTIPYRVAGASGSALPYWYDSLTGALSQQDITNIENVVISSDLNALRFKTTHFTPFYLVADDATSGASDSSGGGCSISATGNGSPKELVVPYAAVAIVMAVLRRRDRRRQRLLEGAER